jgi:RNA polymerase sigma-70 factor, ECF subfamily
VELVQPFGVVVHHPCVDCGVEVGVDEQAGFEAFFAEHYDGLLRSVWGYCGDREVAEEAAQEAFVRASRDWRRVRRMDSPAGWLHRVAFNTVHGHFRRLRTRSRVLTRLAEPANDSTEAVDETLMLQSALARLPARQRAVLALHYLADLSISEVAVVMDARPGTVKSLLSRGRAALRAFLVDTASLDKEHNDVH